MNATTCVHCNVTLTAADVDSGWCDSCGKRLPGGPKAPAKHHVTTEETSAPATTARRGAVWAWGGAVLALLAVAVASVVAFAR